MKTLASAYAICALRFYCGSGGVSRRTWDREVTQLYSAVSGPVVMQTTQPIGRRNGESGGNQKVPTKRIQ